MKSIKRKKECILGLVMIALSVFLLVYDKIVINMPAVDRGGYFNRPDVWIRFWALILMVVSVIIVIRAFKPFPDGEEEKPFYVDRTILITSAGLVLYAWLMPILGFEIMTFLLTFLLHIMYVLREENKSFKDYTKKELMKKLGIGVIYSLIMVVALWVVFAIGLSVVLP